MINALLVASLLASATANTKMPSTGDKDPPAVPGMGHLSSGKLSKAVGIRFADNITPEIEVYGRQSGKASGIFTPVPVESISNYAPSVARRFFEEAKWGGKKGKGREIVVRSIRIMAQDGPMYEIQLDLDRVENGKRVGSATGNAVVHPDRSSQRRGAGMVGGFAGAAARSNTNEARVTQDKVAIMQGTMQALERALHNAAVHWR